MTLSRRSALGAVGLGLALPAVARAQGAAAIAPDKVAAAVASLDPLIADAMKNSGVPGLSVAIVHDDKVLVTKGYGVRQAGRPETVDGDTVFQLASVSKPVASSVVAALVGEGVVGWDDPIVQHFPAFAMHEAWVTKEVTLRDMFCHRSGLPDHAGDLLEDLGCDRTEVLYRLRYVKPFSSFRSKYDYTNFGLTAGAQAAALAAGKSWEDVSAEKLYVPLGMRSTSSRFADYKAATNRAVGHVKDGNAWVAKYVREPDAQSPAGGVCSTARDMAQWMRLQLGRGVLEGREIIKTGALDETHRPAMVSSHAANPSSDRAGFYGLGWNVNYEERGIRCSHSGAFASGAATCVNLMPQQRLGIIVLSNTAPVGLPEAICLSFLDLAIAGKIEKDWFAIAAAGMKAISTPDYGTTVDYTKPPAAPTAALATSAYLGNYSSDLYGPLRIEPTGSGLELLLGPKLKRFALRHYNRDVFAYQPTGENAYGLSAVTFRIGASQRAETVTVENLNITGQGTFTRTA
ncbi:penicillin-binding protein 4* [Variibacter gotjawalensis]|uniref:Penicillin-binding protein 4 n=1 Tax=Variibacter gotjawalensis TaxID=1333996 RepID=A0A0S3Q155_9BRAD|nr:serine hydrolase [Variibacter gotjawalensis]NIK47737.1 CubicO group peptidase (beta-lactamase class C family) [Variibacter gotjawalensis]RZS49626.1 CubicO group peptidase (beta-lactamase class C family) [Variibacter gotjawalensis]BAT61890.1 penicillin-binding protein 4* [Variibacter gotjawalensis]